MAQWRRVLSLSLYLFLHISSFLLFLGFLCFAFVSSVSLPSPLGLLCYSGGPTKLFHWSSETISKVSCVTFCFIFSIWSSKSNLLSLPLVHFRFSSCNGQMMGCSSYQNCENYWSSFAVEISCWTFFCAAEYFKIFIFNVLVLFPRDVNVSSRCSFSNRIEL